MRCFGNPMNVFGFVLCDILYCIMKSFSLIHGRKYDWSNHVKILCTICMIILSLCS